MSAFKHVVQEEEKRIERREHWEAEIDGYDVSFECWQDESGHLKIYPQYDGRQSGLRIGILDCRPRDVAMLRRFAADASSLLNKIADELEASGKTDFRSIYDREREEFMASLDARPNNRPGSD